MMVIYNNHTSASFVVADAEDQAVELLNREAGA